MSVRTEPEAAGPALPVEIAVRQICGQHRNLARVLKLQDDHAKGVASGRCAPDFPLLAAVLRYIETFSYGQHHPAEERYLFSAMRQHGVPGPVLDRVTGAHAWGVKRFLALQAAFAAWRHEPGSHHPPFLALAPRYALFEAEHIAFEESVVLPCAVDTLPASDWVPIASAFLAHDDPLSGGIPAPEFAPLHRLLAAGPALA